MEINFQKVGDKYVSEFKVEGDYNLHIEGVWNTHVKVFQRGCPSGEYAYVSGATENAIYGKVYDFECPVWVKPKWFKVECDEQPTMAVVTFNE